jgi:hypothetical protein
MRQNVKAAAAGFLAFAAMLSVPLGAAEARNWRSYVDQYGGGNWVDKYVSEDKNGNVRYKGSKNDKWSGEYYDNKTGKWTGKQYDGDGKTASKSGSTTSKSETAPVASNKSSTKTPAAKSASTKTYATKPVDPALKASETLTNAPDSPATEAGALEAETPPVEVAPKKVGPQARLVPETELYGPPMPPEFATASAAK